MSCMFSLVLPGIPFLNWQDGVLKERSHLTCRGNWSLNSEMQKKMERGVQDAREEGVKQKRDSSNLPRVPLHLWPNLIISSCARSDPTISFVVQSLSHVWLFVTLWTLAHVSVVHGVPQARMLDYVAMPSSSGMEVIFLTQKSNQHPLWFLPCRILYHWSTGEAKKSQKWIYIIFRHFYLTYLTMYFWVSKYFVACNSK